jgi:hypothetical protein
MYMHEMDITIEFISKNKSRIYIACAYLRNYHIWLVQLEIDITIEFVSQNKPRICIICAYLRNYHIWLVQL